MHQPQLDQISFVRKRLNKFEKIFSLSLALIAMSSPSAYSSSFSTSSSKCLSCEALSLMSFKSDWSEYEFDVDDVDDDDDATICAEPLTLSDYSDLFYRSFRYNPDQ